MKKLLMALLAAAATLAAAPCRADLQDEIQVYDDAINEPRELGLELHVNTTPSGRRSSNYPGEVPPIHALRLTPEFSWGLTKTVELGLYIPTVLKPNGVYDMAGGKLRLKWLPLQPQDGRGPFAGVNFELSRLAFRYSESRVTGESRFIFGWRDPVWLVAVNPILGYSLSPGFRGRPDFDLGVKVSHRITEGIAGGVELYNGLGQLGRTLPWQQQDNRIFFTLDVDRKPLPFNIGVGYGLTRAADRWTIKAIFEVPMPQFAR